MDVHNLPQVLPLALLLTQEGLAAQSVIVFKKATGNVKELLLTGYLKVKGRKCSTSQFLLKPQQSLLNACSCGSGVSVSGLVEADANTSPTVH